MRKTIIALTAAAFASSAMAQDVKNQLNPIYHGVTSLAIAPDARAAGMGDIGAATDPDVNSQYWKPGQISILHQPCRTVGQLHPMAPPVGVGHRPCQHYRLHTPWRL